MWNELGTAMAAMGQGQPQGGATAGFTALLPILFMVLIFYWLLIRPQLKEKRRHQEMISELKRGDRVITTGGLLGKIVSVDESTVSIEVGNKMRVDVLKSAIRGMQSEDVTQE